MFSAVKNDRNFERVSQKIKTFIFDGTLKPGDKLPSEADLAKQFKVGRQTIREAHRILELSGLITIKKGYGGGPRISHNIQGRITSLLLDALRMEKISTEDFTVARLTIEKAIINSAVNNADDRDVGELKKNIASAKELIARNELATDLNFEFHALLATASKNKVFIIIERTINAIHQNLRSRREADIETSITAIQAHEKILDALIKRDCEKTLYELERHIIKVRKSY